MDHEEIVNVVRTYERNINEGNRESQSELFTDDATFYDPIGRLEEFAAIAEDHGDHPGLPPAFVGKENVMVFFQQCGEYFENWEFTVNEVFVNTDLPGAAFEWQGYGEDGDLTLTPRAVDIFEMTDGQVHTVRGYIATPDAFHWK